MSMVPVTPGEQQFHDILELINNKDTYTKRFKELKEIKDAAHKESAILQERINTIDAWERQQAKREEVNKNKELQLEADKQALTRDKAKHNETVSKENKRLNQEDSELSSREKEVKTKEEELEHLEKQLATRAEQVEAGEQALAGEVATLQAKKKSLDELMRQ